MSIDFLLPQRFRDLIRDSKALLIRNDRGTWLCYEKGCFKLFRKFETFALDLVSLLSDKCMTLSEIARVLALPYDIAKGRVYYYHYSGLLKREGPYYCLNDDHPQLLFFLKITTTRPFFNGKNRLKLVEIGKERTGSIIINSLHSYNIRDKVEERAELGSISLGGVLEKARKILPDLTQCEEALIRALYTFWKETGSLYVETCDEVEIFDTLSRFWPELGSSCRDTLELREALKRLAKPKIVFVHPRPCKIRLGYVVLPIGKRTKKT